MAMRTHHFVLGVVVVPFAVLIDGCHKPEPGDIPDKAVIGTEIRLYTPITLTAAPVRTDATLQPPVFELRAGSQQPARVPTSIAPPAPTLDRCDSPMLDVYTSSAAMRFSLDVVLLRAVIRAESACQSGAVSNKGARGLMQLMPEFGARDAYLQLYGVDGIPTDAALADPKVNILLGAAYLRILLDDFAFIPDGEPRMRVVLAAWNWGPTRVSQRLPQFGGWSERDHSQRWVDWTQRRTPAETRRFTARVLRLLHTYRQSNPIWTPSVAATPTPDYAKYANVYTATYQ